MIRSIHPLVTEVSVVDQREGHLFESQFPTPDGITYNTWLVRGEGKIALLDTVDSEFCSGWLQELSSVLGEKKLDYLVISHMEPDHSGSIEQLLQAYPETALVGNAKTFGMLNQFLPDVKSAERIVVKEGDTLDLNGASLQFYMAPMVHWPEVMFAYEASSKTLFSADAFGTFGAQEKAGEEWADEALRYYANIVGKYGPQVAGVLKKVSALSVDRICPLHGPSLADLKTERALQLYGAWAQWQPTEEGVAIVNACFHGNTLKAAQALQTRLEANGVVTELINLDPLNLSYAVAAAFRRPKIVLCCTTYNGGYAPFMEAFLTALKGKGLQGRTFALIENGSWAPMAAKHMRLAIEELKNCTVLPQQLTLRSSLSPSNLEELEEFVRALEV